MTLFLKMTRLAILNAPGSVSQSPAPAINGFADAAAGSDALCYSWEEARNLAHAAEVSVPAVDYTSLIRQSNYEYVGIGTCAHETAQDHLTLQECRNSCARSTLSGGRRLHPRLLQVQCRVFRVLLELAMHTVQAVECPSDCDDILNCRDAACIELYEGDGECETDKILDNCAENYDVYRKHCTGSVTSPPVSAILKVPSTPRCVRGTTPLRSVT